MLDFLNNFAGQRATISLLQATIMGQLEFLTCGQLNCSLV